MAQKYFDEEAILEEELIKNNIKYQRRGNTFWVFSDAYPESRTLVLTCHSESEMWQVIEFRNDEVWHSYNQFIQIILSMVVKFKNGEPY